MQLVSSRHHPAFSSPPPPHPPPSFSFFQMTRSLITLEEGQMYSTYFPFTFFFPFFFSFQIYHSPIHKQAESKSLTITPVTENICIQSFAFYLPVVFSPPTVELNETGFKFVRKCINYIETKGKVHPGCLFSTV